MAKVITNAAIRTVDGNLHSRHETVEMAETLAVGLNTRAKEMGLKTRYVASAENHESGV